ncbi:hypothetical protein ACQ4PT_003110 [Festuca glaucescens]
MADKALAGSSGTAAGGGAEIDDMFSHLELNKDELDGVVIRAEKAKVYQDAARWLAIGKVLTNRTFSAESLFEKMKGIWNLSREPDCCEAGENLFIFQMHCLGDWKKVVHQGPWIFRGFGLLVEYYDGLSAPENFVFNGMYVWAQIHSIPELYRKSDIVDDLARKIGKVKEVQLAPKLFFEGNYVRVRVRINIEKALMRGGATTGFARKQSSEEASLDDNADLTYTGTSPMKTTPTDLGTEGQTEGKETTTCVSRKLDMNSVEVSMEDNTRESGTQKTDTLHAGAAPPPPLVYVDPRDRVKLRKTGEPTNNLSTSAASVEEDR